MRKRPPTMSQTSAKSTSCIFGCGLGHLKTYMVSSPPGFSTCSPVPALAFLWKRTSATQCLGLRNRVQRLVPSIPLARSEMSGAKRTFSGCELHHVLDRSDRYIMCVSARSRTSQCSLLVDLTELRRTMPPTRCLIALAIDSGAAEVNSGSTAPGPRALLPVVLLQV